MLQGLCGDGTVKLYDRLKQKFVNIQSDKFFLISGLVTNSIVEQDDFHRFYKLNYFRNLSERNPFQHKE